MQTAGQMVGERPGIPLLQWWENVKNTYEIITSKNGLSNMVKKKGKITDMSIRLVDLMIAPEMVKRMKRFVDRNTLSKRLRKVDSIWC